MRRVLVSAGVCVALCGLACPAVEGGEITGRPSVRSALAMAWHYWGRAVVPVDVQTTREAGPVPDALAYADAGTHTIRLTRLFFLTYRLGQPDRLWALTGVVVHEYGHLLGYGHGLYAADPLGIMRTGEGYLSWPGAPYPVEVSPG